MGYGFHSKDGLYFQRGENGDVVIRKVDNGVLTMEVVLDKDSWASAVASVCARGENSFTFRQALHFHELKK